MAGSHDPYVRTPYEWYIAGTWGIASLFLLYAWWRLPGGGPMLIPAGVSGSLALLFCLVLWATSPIPLPLAWLPMVFLLIAGLVTLAIANYPDA